MNYTSIEQSKKLLELGLSPDTADMCYEYQTDKWVGEPDYNEYPIPTHAAHKRDIPCWSTDALLQALPFECNLHAFNTECGKVYRLESFQYQKTKTYSTPIEAVFAIAVVDLENPEPPLY